MGVLAQVRHATIGGAEIDLSDEEAKELQTMQRLPSSASQRLAVDADRNERIIGDILSRHSDWPILVFAASVQHAQILAAMLSAVGVSARPISGDTEAGTRRHYIESFRNGRLRVLTNYNVLTAGFDAPAVRAVYVARPTFSPTSYQQMVGRGLRGPKNGGKQECLIVNVADNFARYGTSLAFTEFDYLWSED
jgi:superfamily II DNA or RNA helicase